MRAKIRITYEFTRWYPNLNTNLPQTITPYSTIGSGLLIFVNNVATTTSFQLVSSQDTSFPLLACTPSGSFLSWIKTTQVYETTTFVNNLTLNSLIEVQGVGFAWAWNTAMPNNSYPQCPPGVSGTSTVQIFNVQLSNPANCQCILPPQDKTIGSSQIYVTRRATTLIGNVGLNTPINTSCTV